MKLQILISHNFSIGSNVEDFPQLFGLSSIFISWWFKIRIKFLSFLYWGCSIYIWSFSELTEMVLSLLPVLWQHRVPCKYLKLLFVFSLCFFRSYVYYFGFFTVFPWGWIVGHWWFTHVIFNINKNQLNFINCMDRLIFSIHSGQFLDLNPFNNDHDI